MSEGRVPEAVQDQVMFAVRAAANGEKADTVKPLRGVGSGVFEIALRQRGNAFRLIYAVQLDEDVWVLHAFQKSRRPAPRRPSKKSIWFGSG